MNMIKKYRSRSLWLAALLMVATMAGCDSTSSSSSDAEVPIVVKTVPVTEAVDVVRNTNVVVTFSEEMDDTSITTDSFTVIGLNEDALIGTIVYDAASKSVSFDPNRSFTANTVHTATVTTAVKSADGISMEEGYVWTFTSGDTLDIAPPTVVSTDPLDADTDVPLNRSVTATFSETLEPSSVNSLTFTLKKGSTLVPGAVSYDSKVTTFNPTDDLDASTVYTATLTTGIKDVAGNALATAKVWSFTTGAALAVGPDPINLRTAENFAIVTATGITSADGTASITGNIGASGITGASITVACTELVGGSEVFTDDANYAGATCTSTDKTAAGIALSDVLAAYTNASDPATPAGVGAFLNIGAGTVATQTLAPGVYTWGGNVTLTGDITLDGGVNDVWVFQIDGTLNTSSAIILAGEAQAKNVFWRASEVVTLGTGAQFKGIVLAKTRVDLITSATIEGRLLAQTAVGLGSATVVAQPAE
ncbi:MAG: DUF3494 domain-containing protein [Thiomicrospira sp.]|uniref:ice-binding family protein n=1 Tax=Thiomicrospira sp. TaxID=935 RepID=UPI0019FBC97F|nr:ice-binding family protein [Thiomicrospira sp.]MBE0494028.1 DUF3494 domain-containing protein [Thiomicrospira sp.]